MRVTQSMLSGNMLRNLSNSYAKMGKLQNQIENGKKVTRPSDDPVVAMKGIGYRTSLNSVQQFQRNIGEVNSWLDTSDNTLNEVNSSLQRTRELMVQAANGSTTSDDRDKIKSELSQIQEHIQNLANTQMGDKYIFSGTKTTTPTYQQGVGFDTSDAAFKSSVKMEVFDGIQIEANTTPINLFKNIDDMFQTVNSATTSDDFSNNLADLDKNLGDLLTKRAEIGARQNRVELMDNRLTSQEMIATKLMSDNEDVQYDQAISDMITQESVHRAALSAGAKIIQPSLTDFLR